MRHRLLAALVALMLAAATPAVADEAAANQLFVDAVLALAGFEALPDAVARLERLDAAEAALHRLVEDFPATAAARRAVELLYPDAVARLALLPQLRVAAEAELDAAPAPPGSEDAITARAASAPAFARLSVCTEAAPSGCLRAAATAKLIDLGLLDVSDGGQAAALAGLDVVELVAAGEELPVPADDEALWSRTTAIYAALDLWSQVGGVASLGPWEDVPPEALPADLGGSLAALTAHLTEREREADAAVQDIVANTCGPRAAPAAAILAPALCREPPALAELDEIWQALPPFQRLGALEALGQAMRSGGHQALWAAFLFGLERPEDLTAEEAASLARILIGGAVAWRVGQFR